MTVAERERFGSVEEFVEHTRRRAKGALARHLEFGDRVLRCTSESCGWEGCRGFQWVMRGTPEWDDAEEVPLRSGDEVVCCGNSYTFIAIADVNPPIPERYWPGDTFQVDGDWQGDDCVACGRPLTEAEVVRRLQR